MSAMTWTWGRRWFTAAIFTGVVSLAISGVRAQAPVNQTASGIVYAMHADGTCTSNDCAKATTLRVYLPLDANITKIRLRSAGPDRDQMHDNNPGDDIEWAVWLPPVQGTTPTNKFVDAKFLNRSHNKKRKVELVVEWTSRR